MKPTLASVREFLEEPLWSGRASRAWHLHFLQGESELLMSVSSPHEPRLLCELRVLAGERFECRISGPQFNELHSLTASLYALALADTLLLADIIWAQCNHTP